MSNLSRRLGPDVVLSVNQQQLRRNFLISVWLSSLTSGDLEIFNSS